MSTIFSVVICTYNPRAEYLNQVLDALSNQSLSRDRWELIIIDNNSQPSIAQRRELRLPDFCKVIIESQLGLTPARIRGIKETVGDAIVFVDDDNVLALNYLEQLFQLHQQHPKIGVWSGTITPIFEVEPAEGTQPYWQYLALRQVEQEIWSNIPQHAPLPCGAGMYVRRDVAVQYCQDTVANPLRFMMDRKGQSLLAGGDTDIGLAACDLGLGVGLSPNLNVEHLIPAGRVELAYLNNLVESITYSHELLFLVRGIATTRKRRIVKWKIEDSIYPILDRQPSDFIKHRRKGSLRAHVDYLRYKSSGIIPSADTSEPIDNLWMLANTLFKS